MASENSPGEPAESEPPSYEPRRRYPLHVKILVGLMSGALLGLLANALGSGPLSSLAQSIWPHEPATLRAWIDDLAMNVADPLGRIFLRLVLMVVVPLVFSALRFSPEKGLRPSSRPRYASNMPAAPLKP